MRLIRFLLIGSLLIFSVSCELFDNVGDVVSEDLPEELSTEEVVNGLKTALEVGTDSSSTTLGLIDGYYGNALLKILLPEEVQNVKTNITNIVNDVPVVSDLLDLDQQFENLTMAINRAAESAAREASPIFKDAINDLTISQGLDILQGVNPLDSLQKNSFDSTAATNYFKGVTQNALITLYGSKIDQELDKDLGLGFSANQAWNTLRTNYNNAVETINNNFIYSSALSVLGYEVNELQLESIGAYSTEKALNGLFYLVGEEEKNIRRNPLEWALTKVGDILEKVFTWFETH